VGGRGKGTVDIHGEDGGDMEGGGVRGLIGIGKKRWGVRGRGKR